MVDVGQKMPDFSLAADDGREYSLKDFANKRWVLFIYPKADTPGWTTEACGFRDDAAKFTKKGIAVVGLSKDTVEAQKKFKEKYRIAHPLLADPDKTLLTALGVIKEKNMYGKKVMGTARTTFLIGADGKIEKVWNDVSAEGHSKEVLAAL